MIMKLLITLNLFLNSNKKKPTQGITFCQLNHVWSPSNFQELWLWLELWLLSAKSCLIFIKLSEPMTITMTMMMTMTMTMTLFFLPILPFNKNHSWADLQLSWACYTIYNWWAYLWDNSRIVLANLEHILNIFKKNLWHIAQPKPSPAMPCPANFCLLEDMWSWFVVSLYFTLSNQFCPSPA